MRKKRTLLLCAACVLLAGLATLAFKPARHEPSYDGHPLSFWVATLGADPNGSNDEAQAKKAAKAIDHIGTAALPFLVKWLQYEPPQWRVRLASSLDQCPIPFVDNLSGLIMHREDVYLAPGTRCAFAVLGTRAMPALHDLCRLMNDTNNPTAANIAATSLGSLGTNALPPLLAVVTNNNHPARAGALGATRVMSGLDNAAQIATVDAITTCLTDTNLEKMAATVLGELTIAPQLSVPALVSSLKSKDEQTRLWTATVLGNFGRRGIGAVPALTNAALTDPDPLVRQCAVQSLHKIDPATFTGAPLH